MKKTLAMLLALMLSLACLSFGYAEEAAPEQTEHIAGMLAISMGTEEDADEVARKNFPNLLFSNQFFPDLSSMLLALKAGKINSIALTSGKVDLIYWVRGTYPIEDEKVPEGAEPYFFEVPKGAEAIGPFYESEAYHFAIYQRAHL